MQNSIPLHTQKYFWGDDLNQLNWKDHQSYIVQTLLEKGDVEAISWLFKQLSKETLREIAGQLKLSAKSRNFWDFYLA